MLQLSNIPTQYQYYNSQINHPWQLRLELFNDDVILQLTLKQSDFVILENLLVALVARCYLLIDSSCFCSIYLLFFAIFLKIICAYFLNLIVGNLLRGFEIIVYPCWWIINFGLQE